MEHHDVRRTADAGDRSDITKIVVELVVERGANRICHAAQEECIAVRRRTQGRLAANIAGGARPVLDDQLLAEPLRQPLTDQPCSEVDRSTCRERRDQPYRTRRIGLRRSEPRHRRQRGSTHCQVQKSTTGKFHDCLLNGPVDACGPASMSFRRLSFDHLVGAGGSVGGTSRPSALAVLRLMANSNLVATCTGRLPGFSPLRIRST